MRNEVKYVLGLIGLGASLVIYAQVNFPTRSEHKQMKTMIETYKSDRNREIDIYINHINKRFDIMDDRLKDISKRIP